MSRRFLWFLAIAFLLVLTLGFGLGYLVAKQAHPAPIIIEKNSP